MSIERKKMVAVTSAVAMYIKSQEEAAAYAAMAAQEADAPPETGRAAQMTGLANAWGMAGRTAHMQARTLMQMRAFK